MTPAIPSNMTPREAYRLHGALSPEHIEALLDLSDVADKFEGISPSLLGDAAGCYPAEDCMHGIIASIQGMLRIATAKNQLRPALLELLDEVESFEMETYRTSEYGRDELRKAEATLATLGERS